MKAWQFLPSSWTSYVLPTNIQKRLYMFLLRKAIGQFLAKDLDLDNFDIELYNGSVELRDLDLNLETLNDCIADTPFVLAEGRVGSITASLPWSNLSSGNISLKVQGLYLTLCPVKNRKRSRPKEDDDPPIMSSSLHFADDFLRTEMEDQELMDSIQKSVHMSAAEGDVDIGTEGLQVIARVIDKMLAKVKVDVVDTTIRILHKSSAPPLSDNRSNSDNEYYLDLHIPCISYFDETPEFNRGQATTLQSSGMAESSILAPPVPNETIKIITMASPTVWIRSKQTPSSSSMSSMSSKGEVRLQEEEEEEDEGDLDQSEFYEADEGEPPIFHSTNSIHSSFMSGSTTPRAFGTYSALGNNSSKPYEALLFTTLDKDNWVRIQLRPSFPFDANTSPSETAAAAIKQIDLLCTHVRTIVTPRQTAFLLDLLNQINDTWTSHEQSPPESKRRNDFSQDHLAEFDFSMLDQVTQARPNRPFYPDSPRVPQPSTTVTSSPDIKIKFQINTVDLFFLYSDGPDIPLPSSWENPDCPGYKNVGHIKVSMREIVVRYQQFPDSNSPVSRKKSDIPYPASPSPAASLLSKVDVKITRLAIDEWIKRPPYAQLSRKVDNAWQIPYERYIPILEFDDSIMQDYNHDTIFPSIPQTMTPRLRTRSKHGQGSYVIRIRIERKQAHEVSRFVNATTLDEDTRITILPLKLHVDAQVIDRLENYVYACFELTSKWERPTKTNKARNLDNSLGQRIYEDLDRASSKLQLRKSALCRFSFIRILLYVPDMSQVCVRDEFNDLLHSDALSVDIKQLAICWKSEGNEQKPGSNQSSFSHFQSITADARPSADAPTKIQADCDLINVFLKLSRENAAKCWFTAKTVVPLNVDGYAASVVTTSQSPSFEIIIRSADSIKNSTVSAAKSNYFGSGSDIPSNLFEHLSKNEPVNVNHKPHIPMEDQTESAMIFKQRTVETSMFVVNCHFPSTRMNLSKEVWDTVQILQNDLLLWKPRFLSRLPTRSDTPAGQETDQTMASDVYSSGRPHSFDFDMAHSVRSSSMLSQSHERLGYNLQTPSMLSLIAVMSDALWDLHYASKENETKGSYRLHMSEFRYFTVVKHLGTDENVTTLDIDELDLHRVAPNKVPIVYKTISSDLSPKRNTAMVSVFAKLANDYELNKQHKITSVVVCNLCWRFSMDLGFLEQLIDFQKIPEEMVFIDPPTQYNKIYAHILDTSVDYKPIHLPSRAIVVVDELQVVTDIVSSGQPIQSVKAFLERMDFMLVDDAREIDDQHYEQVFRRHGSMCVDAKQYWANMGFPSVMSLLRLEALIKAKTDDMVKGPKVEITIANNVLALEGCTDSFHSLLNFLTYTANQGDLDAQSEDRKGKKAVKKQPIVTSHRHGTDGDEDLDILASLDPEAFQRAAAKVMSTSQDQSTSLDLSFVEGYYSAQGSRSDPPPQKPRRKHAINKATEGEFRILLDDLEELKIVENFYNLDMKTPQPPKPTFDNSRSTLSVRVSQFDIVWNLYDGYDAKCMNETAANKNRRHRPASSSSLSSNHYFFGESLSRTSSIDTSATGATHTSSPIDRDFLSHSPSFSSTTGDDVDRLDHRPSTPDVEIHVDGISLEFDLLPDTEKTGINLVLDVRDFEIIDNVKTSSWNKFLGYMRPGSHSLPRERGSMMLHLELSSMRPVQNDPTQEFRIKFKLLPIRLYVDQDALNFMVKYFTFDKSLLKSTAFANATIKVEKQEDTQEIFFQTIEIYPIVLKVDYKAKYINYGNIKEGQLAELVNLFNLDGADFQLSHVRLTGVNGFRRLGDRLMQEWLPHIKNTQVPHVISGVSPIRSVVNLGNGVADLVLLPIQQYRRDGRIIRGLQKGTQSFAKATAMEAIKLTARFASGAQVILEQADDFFSSTSRREQYVADAVELFEDEEGYIYATTVPASPKSAGSGPATAASSASSNGGTASAGLTPPPSSLSKFANQPSDLSQGFHYAYQSLSRNLGAAAHTVFAVPTEVIGEDGSHTKAVIRAVPVAVIKPMIGLTGAFHSIMVGLRNSIDPNMRLQSQDKYKKR